MINYRVQHIVFFYLKSISEFRIKNIVQNILLINQLLLKHIRK